MARKPNYDYERRERERIKNLRAAARIEAKLKPAVEESTPEGTPEPDAE